MAERTDISKKDRHAILREAGYACAVPTCGTTLAMDLHHIWEVKNGGGNELANLIALCPTHHALYHRGFISPESIAEWKSRLVSINEIGSTTIAKILSDMVRSANENKSNGQGVATGFSLAAAEYSQRTCEIGFVLGSDGKRFVRTGLCCFVSSRVALTVGWVIKATETVAKARSGKPVIKTMRGPVPFEVIKEYDVGELVSVRIGEIDDRYVKSIVPESDPDIARGFYEPLQTDIKFRIVPFVGEAIGFLSCSNADDEWKSALTPFRFESGFVAFMARGHERKEFAQYFLSPTLSRLEYRGAPVFLENGSLVGLIRDSVQFPSETGFRPMITSVIPLKSLLGASAKTE